MSPSLHSEPPPRYESPMRPNSFFTHLNRDIRYMVYDHLDLPPISLDSLGLVLSCREALAETEQAARPQLNRRLLAFKAAAWAEGHAVILPKLSDQSTFRELNIIEIACQKEPLYYDSNTIEVLLGCCFAEVSFLCKAQEQFEALLGAQELAAEQPYYGDLNFPRSHHMCTSSAKFPDSHLMEIAMRLVMRAIEGHRSYRNGPIRTKCITMAWGETPVDLMSEVQGFEYLEGSYSNSHKDTMRRNGVISRNYAWPAWRRFSRIDGTAGMISLSSANRWANGLDRWALIDEMVARKNVLDFWSSWRDAPMD